MFINLVVEGTSGMLPRNFNYEKACIGCEKLGMPDANGPRTSAQECVQRGYEADFDLRGRLALARNSSVSLDPRRRNRKGNLSGCARPFPPDCDLQSR